MRQMIPWNRLLPRTRQEYEKVLRQFRAVPPPDLSTWSTGRVHLLRSALRHDLWEKYLRGGLAPNEAIQQASLDTDRMAPSPGPIHYREVLPPSQSEVGRFIGAARALPTGEQALVLMPLAMGLRSKELLSLSRETVERALETANLLVLRKGDKEQLLPAGGAAKLLAMLLEAPKAPGVTDLSRPQKEQLGRRWETAGEILSPATLDTQYKLYHRLVRAVGKRAGVKVRPHLLRHAFSQQLYREGVDLLTIQKLLGHESLETTQKYVHADVERARNLMPEF